MEHLTLSANILGLWPFIDPDAPDALSPAQILNKQPRSAAAITNEKLLSDYSVKKAQYMLELANWAARQSATPLSFPGSDSSSASTMEVCGELWPQLLLHAGFQDGAFALAMSTFWDGKTKVLRVRKRPKETAGNAKISRKSFGNQPTKKLLIPELFDEYNHHMGDIDIGDQLQSHNGGLRRLRRGPNQALHQYMLLVVLSNCYLISRNSNYDLQHIKLRSQDDFRLQLIEALMAVAKDAPESRKQLVSALSAASFKTPLHSHELIKMKTRANCRACKGGRFGDRPAKRVALREVTPNNSSQSVHALLAHFLWHGTEFATHAYREVDPLKLLNFCSNYLALLILAHL
ncbi:hypothetical protein IFR05_013570 [Cadophora sp. M221]|nr:hypothetical protein IFR05_013570 [Cadophora sp. M221]